MARQYKTLDQMWKRADVEHLADCDAEIDLHSEQGWDVLHIRVQLDFNSSNENDYVHRIVTLSRPLEGRDISGVDPDGIPF